MAEAGQIISPCGTPAAGTEDLATAEVEVASSSLQDHVSLRNKDFHNAGEKSPGDGSAIAEPSVSLPEGSPIISGEDASADKKSPPHHTKSSHDVMGVASNEPKPGCSHEKQDTSTTVQDASGNQANKKNADKKRKTLLTPSFSHLLLRKGKGKSKGKGKGKGKGKVLPAPAGSFSGVTHHEQDRGTTLAKVPVEPAVAGDTAQEETLSEKITAQKAVEESQALKDPMSSQVIRTEVPAAASHHTGSLGSSPTDNLNDKIEDLPEHGTKSEEDAINMVADVNNNETVATAHHQSHSDAPEDGSAGCKAPLRDQPKPKRKGFLQRMFSRMRRFFGKKKKKQTKPVIEVITEEDEPEVRSSTTSGSSTVSEQSVSPFESKNGGAHSDSLLLLSLNEEDKRSMSSIVISRGPGHLNTTRQITTVVSQRIAVQECNGVRSLALESTLHFMVASPSPEVNRPFILSLSTARFCTLGLILSPPSMVPIKTIPSSRLAVRDAATSVIPAPAASPLENPSAVELGGTQNDAKADMMSIMNDLTDTCGAMARRPPIPPGCKIIIPAKLRPLPRLPPGVSNPDLQDVTQGPGLPRMLPPIPVKATKKKKKKKKKGAKHHDEKNAAPGPVERVNVTKNTPRATADDAEKSKDAAKSDARVERPPTTPVSVISGPKAPATTPVPVISSPKAPATSPVLVISGPKAPATTPILDISAPATPPAIDCSSGSSDSDPSNETSTASSAVRGPVDPRNVPPPLACLGPNLVRILQRLVDHYGYGKRMHEMEKPAFIDGSRMRYVIQDGQPVRLGRGANGQVFLAGVSMGGKLRLAAVKLYPRDTGLWNILWEAYVATHLNSTGATAECYGLVGAEPHVNFRELGVVFEFLGDPATYRSWNFSTFMQNQARITPKGDKNAPWNHILQMVQHLKAINDKEVYINDIKFDNVLFYKPQPDGEWTVKYIDVGNALFKQTSYVSRHSPRSRRMHIRNHPQLAPEYLMDGKCGPETDIYSLGRLINDAGIAFDSDDMQYLGVRCTCHTPCLRFTAEELSDKITKRMTRYGSRWYGWFHR